MTEMVRMGVSASVAEDRRPLGRSTSIVVAIDEAGNEVGREEVVEPDGLVLSVTHFVDLDDGRRLTTAHLGDMTVSVRHGCAIDEVRAELRELIFEDEPRELDLDPADESPWDDMLEVLRGADVAADENALERLPFVFELDDEVASLLSG